MIKNLTCYLLASLVFLAARNTNNSKISEDDGLSAFSADSLRLHVAELSDDSLQGRKPFTQGETKTIAYLQKKFKENGLEPGNGDSYLQEVPMVNIKTTAAPENPLSFQNAFLYSTENFTEPLIQVCVFSII